MGRKRIGLFFNYNTNWIGGTYYWLNWVNALNTLPDEEKPLLVILATKKDYSYLKKETGYPYLEFQKWQNGYTLAQKAFNAIFLRTIGRRVWEPKLKGHFDALVPSGCGGDWEYGKRMNTIAWFPDFQYAHLPEFYTPQKYVDAAQRALSAAYLSYKLMLSSEDAAADFHRLFPNSKAKVYVQPFTVTHPDFSDVKKEDVFEKFAINRPYFYSPNQYWAHKNHSIVIDAVTEIVKRGQRDILVLFSGKEWDDRNLDYVPSLKQKVKDLGLEDNIRFLGFLVRKEQLVIMQNAEAVIQPSLFEGWSTVIEDAQALGTYVIASNLAVNQEQIQKNVRFFDPRNVESLVEAIKMGNFMRTPIDYHARRIAQARRFMQMVEDL